MFANRLLSSFSVKQTLISHRFISRCVALHAIPLRITLAQVRDVALEYGPIVQIKSQDFIVKPISITSEEVTEDENQPVPRIRRQKITIEFKNLTSAINFYDEKQRTVMFGNRVEMNYVAIPGSRNEDNEPPIGTLYSTARPKRLFGDPKYDTKKQQTQ